MLFASSASCSAFMAARQLGSCRAALTDEGIGDGELVEVCRAYLGLGLKVLTRERVTMHVVSWCRYGGGGEAWGSGLFGGELVCGVALCVGIGVLAEGELGELGMALDCGGVLGWCA